MEFSVSLRYPNGQTHETTISLPSTVRAGFEFSAFGRRWRVVESHAAGDGEDARPMICEYVGFDTGTLVGRLSERAAWTGEIA